MVYSYMRSECTKKSDEQNTLYVVNGQVLLPSYNFREGLLQPDPENKNTQILLIRSDRFSLVAPDPQLWVGAHNFYL